MDDRARRAALLREGALLLYVAAGGALGAVLRGGLSLMLLDEAQAAWPWATFAANFSGSFLIGFFAQLTAPEGRLLLAPRWRHFVMTGVLGGYTTFSIFSLECLRLAQAGAWLMAGAYVGASLICWMAAVWLGDSLARRYNKLRETRP